MGKMVVKIDVNKRPFNKKSTNSVFV